MIFKIYTGGYYDANTGDYGSGAVILNSNNVSVATLSEKGKDTTKFRGIAEIQAVEKALRHLYKHYQPKAQKAGEKLCATIFYRADGIMKWGSGVWDANKEITINYQKCIQNASKVMDIGFEKADAKTMFSVIAGQLAEQAVVPVEDAVEEVVEGTFVVPMSDNSTAATNANEDKIVVKLVLDKEQLMNEYESPDAFIECVMENLPVVSAEFE